MSYSAYNNYIMLAIETFAAVFTIWSVYSSTFLNYLFFQKSVHVRGVQVSFLLHVP